MAINEALQHPDFWGDGVTDDDRVYALSRSDKTFDAKSPADKALFVKNLADTRRKNDQQQAQSQQQATDSAEQAHSGYMQRFGEAYKAAVAPVTKAVALAGQYSPIDAAQAGVSRLTRGAVPMPTPTSSDSVAETGAKLVVPQTPTEAAIMLGTGGAGKVLGTAGKVVPRLATMLEGVGTGSRALKAGARIAGATAGGALGGEIEGEGAGSGALQGLLSGGLGEGVAYAGGKAMRSFPGAAKRIAKQDAARVGQAVEEISPSLGGARTVEGLNELASGAGLQRLGQAKQAVVSEIEKRVPSISVPALGGQQMTLREANQAMSEIGAKAFSKNPLDRTANGVDQKKLYHEIADQIRTALDQADPASAKLWTAAQGQYAKGRVLVDEVLRQGSAYTGDPKGMVLKTPELQKLLRHPETLAELRRALSDEEFKNLVAAVTRGGAAGAQDLIRTESATAWPGVGAILRRMGGLAAAGTAVGGAPGAAIGTLVGAAKPFIFPNSASRYAGRAPYVAKEGVKALLDMLAAKGVTSASRPAREE